MFETIEKEKINSFKNNLSKCVNVTRKVFTNKQLLPTILGTTLLGILAIVLGLL